MTNQFIVSCFLQSLTDKNKEWREHTIEKRDEAIIISFFGFLYQTHSLIHEYNSYKLLEMLTANENDTE